MRRAELMGKLSELKGVEKPVTEWLSKIGWTFQSNEDLKVYNRPFSNPVISQPWGENIRIITSDCKKSGMDGVMVEPVFDAINNLLGK